MARPKLGYDVDVLYAGAAAATRALADLQKFYAELDKVDQAAEEVSESSSSMFDKAKASWGEAKSAIDTISFAFGKAQQAAQQAWDTISRGANLELSTGKAEALAGSIGTSWELLLGQMTEATGGMITQAELTASAVEIIGLGMADTGSEVVRLSKLVGELGWDMQTLTLTLANESTARLDSLGLSVEDVTGRIDGLIAAGVSADEAFTFAVIEAGEEKLKLLGSAAGTAAGNVAELEATWADFLDTIARNASEASSPLVQLLIDTIAVGDAIEDGLITADRRRQAEYEAGNTAKTLGEVYRELAVEIGELETAERNATAYRQIITEQRIEGTQAIIEQADALRDLRSIERRSESQDAQQSELDKDLERIPRVVDGYRSIGIAAEDAVAKQAQFADDAAAAWEEYVAVVQAASGDAFTTAAFDPDQAYDAATATYEWADSVGAGASALSDMGQSLGLVNAEQAEYALGVAQNEAVTKSLAEAAATGAISWKEYELAVKEARRVLEQGPPQQIDEWDATAFFEGGGDNIGGKQSAIVTEIQDAVTDAQGIIDGFMEPDELREIIMGWDGQAVTDGVSEAQSQLDSLKDKTITVHFAATTSDSFEEAMDEID